MRTHAVLAWQPAFVHVVVKQLAESVGHTLAVISRVPFAAPLSK